MILYHVCRCLRIVKSIVLWEDNYYPFWITIYSFLGALVFFFIPWGFLLRWLIRIAVWVFLGPWMKIIDWVYFGQFKNMSAEDKKKMLQDKFHDEYQKTLKQRRHFQRVKERMTKLESMMKYLFGKVCMVAPFAIDMFSICLN